MADPLLRHVDAVTVPVPTLEQGLAFYRDELGHELLWRNDEVGQAGLRLPHSETELVLSTTGGHEANWLVANVEDAVDRMIGSGGRMVAEPRSIPVGRVAVVADPFDNPLVLVDLSVGRYVADEIGRVVGVAEEGAEGEPPLLSGP